MKDQQKSESNIEKPKNGKNTELKPKQSDSKNANSSKTQQYENKDES